MDKKNFAIGALLLVAAFALMILGPKPAPSTQPQNAQPATSAAPASSSATSSAASTPAQPGQAAANVESASSAPAASTTAPAVVHRDPADATITVLANDFIEARLTNYGGAVREVAFKKYPDVQGQPEPYVLNRLHEDPILALVDYKGLDRTRRYELVSATASEVVYRAVLDGNIEVTRRYRLLSATTEGSDPYLLQHETTFRNLTNATQPLPRAGFSVGTSTLVNSKDYGQYMNVASFDGEDPTYTEVGELMGGGFFSIFGAGRPAVSFIEKPGRVVWASTKNQFFSTIFTPEKPGIGVVAKSLALPAFADRPDHPNTGMTGAIKFDLPALAANETTKIAGTLYTGPQEYRRLSKFAQNEDRVLPYTQYFFNRIFLSGFVAPFLNILLNAVHDGVGNWGIAVVLMTLILKFVSLPFTLAASRSAKRMAKLQPLMQEIREKHKDNPQKQQMATMELFKTHKVNPVGGCIPVLITMPLFIGFFAMLQSPAELRFQPFLWAHDLASPDTVGHLFGIAWLPINIMPLLMGATMYYQMRLTPTPTVDNMQMKMMRFMPVVITLVCYQFSCALSLYSTVNGIFTIIQQIIVNRSNDEPGPTGAGTAAASTLASLKKGIKNVTPPKPKK